MRVRNLTIVSIMLILILAQTVLAQKSVLDDDVDRYGVCETGTEYTISSAEDCFGVFHRSVITPDWHNSCNKDLGDERCQQQPPICPYDLDILALSDSFDIDYCLCGSKVIKINDVVGRVCPPNKPSPCNYDNMDSCASDWKWSVGGNWDGMDTSIPGVDNAFVTWPFNTRGHGELGTNPSLKDFALGSISGWAYLNKTTTETISLQMVVDKSMDVYVYRLDEQSGSLMPIGDGKYNHECEGSCNEGDRTTNKELNTDEEFKAGWYFFAYTYFHDVHERQAVLELRVDGSQKNPKNFFDGWSMSGPIPFDGDISKDRCETDYSATYDASWHPNYEAITSSWPADSQRICCGDDPEDFGVYAEGYICEKIEPTDSEGVGKGNWSRVLGTEQCVAQNGSRLVNTAFNPFVADQLIANSYYSPYALNGSDACCGDDIVKIEQTCVNNFAPGTTCSDISSSICLLTPGCDLSDVYVYEYAVIPETCVECRDLDDASPCPEGTEQVFEERKNLNCLREMGTSCSEFQSIIINRTCRVLEPSCEGEIDCSLIENPLDCFLSVCKIESEEIKLNTVETGYISSGNDYACFSNLNNEDYNWSNAYSNENPYLIFEAGNNQFVPNNENWFYCDATRSEPYGSTNKIPEYGTFSMSSGSGKIACTDVMASFFSYIDDVNPEIYDCESSSLDDCKSFYTADNGFELSDESILFCRKDDRGLRSGMQIENPDSNFDACASYCYIYDAENDKWNNVYFNEYNSDVNTFSDFCNLTNNEFFGCSTYVRTGYQNFDSFIGQEAFNSNIPDFDMTSYSAFNACEDIYSKVEELQDAAFSVETKVCDVNSSDGYSEYCKDGYFVASKEEGQSQPQYQCCIGQEAHCEEFKYSTCQELGYEWIEDTTEATCFGEQIGSNCCNGVWSYDPQLYSLQYKINESFMCYKTNEKSMIRECCDINSSECYNAVNRYSSSGIDERLYSLSGVPLHSLNSFDNAYDDSNKYQRARRLIFLEPQSKNITINDNAEGFYSKDWSNFDYLYLDYVTNANETGSITLFDNQENSKSFDVLESRITRKPLTRVNRLRLNLSGDLNLSDMKAIQFEAVKSGVEIWIDNMFLEDVDGSNNSDNYFCAGPYKKWVYDVDGPNGDEGFYNVDSPTLKDIGPYKYACASQGPFQWTGNICCGDDSADGYGEFFIDTKGMCWNGSYVMHNQLLSENIASEDEDDITKYMLFFDGNLTLCAIDSSVLNDIKLSFNETPTDDPFISDDKIDSVLSFTIRGNYICDEEAGWIRLEEFDKVRVMLSILKNQSETYGDNRFSLYCSNTTSISNYYDEQALFEGTFENILNNSEGACLYVKNDASGKPTQTTLGLEIPTDTPVETYLNEALKKFNPTVDYNIDCSGAPDNPETAADFFHECTSDLDYENFYIYYNKPFNIILISSNYLTFEKGFVREIWDAIVEFFKNLFGTGTKPVELPWDLETTMNFREYYINVMSDGEDVKTIKGISQNKFGSQDIRVDYYNLGSSVQLLKEIMQKQNPDAQITYINGGTNQTIRINAPTNQQVNWKPITTKIRLSKNNYGKDFGNPTCKDGKISYGEQCDFIIIAEESNDAIPVNGKPTTPTTQTTEIYMYGTNDCTKYGDYTGGIVTCNDNCKVNTDSCDQEPSCSDELKNQDETDIDCGGTTCEPCQSGKKCSLDSDCQTNYCNKVNTCAEITDPVTD